MLDLAVPSTVYLGLYQYDLATGGDTLQPNQVGTQMQTCLGDSTKCNAFDDLQNYAKIINFNKSRTNEVITDNILEIEQLMTMICTNKNSSAVTKAVCGESQNEIKQALSSLKQSVNTRAQLATIVSSVQKNIESIKPELLTTLKTNAKTYQQSFKDYNTNIVQASTKLTNYAAAIQKNSKTIGGLQQKIQLALKVLNGEGNRLQSLTKNLATYRAQNAQHDQDRVPIGLPYLNPFFTMSNRNYVIMMLVFIVLLVIGIFVYAFVGRRSTV